MTALKSETRPWGRYAVLLTEAGAQVKRVEINPSLRLSLQTHSRRSETWIVTEGRGLVTLDGKETSVFPGSVIQVAIGVKHRMQNTGVEPLVFIEVQQGEYLGEDDIVRFEDDFNRVR